MYGVLAPLHGGPLDPQILAIPQFSIIMKTRWSKYAPGGAVVAALPRGICPDEKTVENARSMIRPAKICPFGNCPTLFGRLVKRMIL